MLLTTSGFTLGRRIAWMVFLLLLVGHMFLFSATGVMGLQRYGSEFFFLSRQAVVAGAGLILLFFLSRIHYALWRRLALPLMLFQVIVTAVTLFSPFAHEAQGASRWLSISGFRFQPSEFAKITVPIYFCHLITRSQEREFPWQTWVITSLPLLGLALELYLQPDLGTTVILAVVIFGSLFYAGLQARYVLFSLVSGGTLLAITLMTSDYRRRRLLSFLDPWADPHGSGFQVIQSFLSFHTGGLFGVGLGNGNSKLFYLPEVHTDFIFALVGEELGFAGAFGLLLAFVYFSYLLFKIPAVTKDPFGKYLSFALALGLVLQIIINLGGVTGLLPVKGLTLPFISWGRSALLANLLMVGILLNILRSSEIISPSTASQEAIPRVEK